MGGYTITIDSGTTNTRAVLWNESREAVAVQTSPTGVRNTAMDGHNRKLKEAVRSCICGILEKQGLEFDDIGRIVASGMITSDVGLVEIPHVTAPAGIGQLAAQMKDVLIEDVCPIPISFIPGIKNCGDSVTIENCVAMDMMRGEEVECIAIMECYPKGIQYLILLPGSHMKFVSVNEAGEITGCLTTISGEILSALTHHTVLASAVGNRYVEDGSYDRRMVIAGYRAAAGSGLGHACFKARIINQFAEPDQQKIAGFILGAVLQSDLETVKRVGLPGVNRNTAVIISGKYPLGKALWDLMTEEGYFRNIQEFCPKKELPLSGLGAFIVAASREMPCGGIL